MQYYRCKCGNLESWGSDGTTPCRACPKCGTTLAQHPDDHRQPVPHKWQTQYDQNTGKPYEICRVCMNRREDVEPLTDKGRTKAVLASIAFERERQKTSEGWTEEHDDAHESGELGMAAACYAASERILVNRYPKPGDAWPWPKEWDKRAKHDRRRQLVIAGALIVAEIERILRQDERDAKRSV